MLLRGSLANCPLCFIQLSIGGYSHKQQILLKKVLDSLFDFEVDTRRFQILKEHYVRGLKNYGMEQPYQHAVYYLALLLTEQAWTKQELLDATKCKKEIPNLPLILIFTYQYRNGETKSPASSCLSC